MNATSTGFKVSPLRGGGESIFVLVGRIVATCNTKEHKCVIFAAEKSVFGRWATESSWWGQLWSYWLSTPELPFCTLLGDAGTGTAWRTLLLCQLAPSQVLQGRQRGRGHAPSCFACCSGRCLSSGLSLPVSSFPHTPSISVTVLSLQRPSWAVPPPHKSGMQLLVVGGPLSIYILITQSLASPPPQFWGGSCFLQLLSLSPQCLPFDFSALQYLLNQFPDIKFFVFLTGHWTGTSGDKTDRVPALRDLTI